MNKECLAYKLKEYVSSGILPMHMPGHKRKVPKAIEEMMTDIYKMDLTEVEGTDNLHDATGIIRDSMEFAKHVYKSNKTYYLINGSSCGILSSIRACACTGNYKNEKTLGVYFSRMRTWRAVRFKIGNCRGCSMYYIAAVFAIFFIL